MSFVASIYYLKVNNTNKYIFFSLVIEAYYSIFYSKENFIEKNKKCFFMNLAKGNKVLINSKRLEWKCTKNIVFFVKY